MKPILFNPENVRKILAGTKTATRRVIETPLCRGIGLRNKQIKIERYHDYLLEQCPYGKYGELLWVQEKWYGIRGEPVNHQLQYKADYPDHLDDALKIDHAYGLYKWQPATIMPFWASRIKLLITRVHVELLHDMTKEDAHKEGCASIDEFRKLWDSINAVRGYSWDVNPAVYVIEFKLIEPVASSSHSNTDCTNDKQTTTLPTEDQTMKPTSKPIQLIKFGTKEKRTADELMNTITNLHLKERDGGRIVDIDIQSVIETRHGYKAFYKLTIK